LKKKLTWLKKVRSVSSINNEMYCLHHIFTKDVE
jgi:hypothetical protein